MLCLGNLCRSAEENPSPELESLVRVPKYWTPTGRGRVNGTAGGNQLCSRGEYLHALGNCGVPGNTQHASARDGTPADALSPPIPCGGLRLLMGGRAAGRASGACLSASSPHSVGSLTSPEPGSC